MEESKTESKKKWSVAELTNIKEYNEKSEWEDQEYDHMSHNLGGRGSCYLLKSIVNTVCHSFCHWLLTGLIHGKVVKR